MFFAVVIAENGDKPGVRYIPKSLCGILRNISMILPGLPTRDFMF